MADCTRARVSEATVSGRLMTLDTVPTETPAARATSLIPTDWAIGRRPPWLRGAAGGASHYRRPAAHRTGSDGQGEVDDMERRRVVPLDFSWWRKGSTSGPASRRSRPPRRRST